MTWRIGLLKRSYTKSLASPFLYRILNRIAMKEIDHIKSSVAHHLSDINVDAILRENKLQIVEKEFFRNKKNVIRVQDVRGNPLILKIGVDEIQMRLMRNARFMERDLCFRVPSIVAVGENWILMEEVQGRFLHEFYEDDPGLCVEVSRNIADDYQHVVRALNSRALGDLLQEGQMRVYSRLNIWSKPIIDVGLLEFSLVQKIAQEFQEVIARKGENFFTWAHGNIIGDHVIVGNGKPILIDLEAVPWVGRGYYDFLRALDFMFLMSPQDAEWMRTVIPQYIKMYTHHYDQEEVRLVFALRNIGVLGWDILHNHVPYLAGDIDKKKEVALQFIKRKY